MKIQFGLNCYSGKKPYPKCLKSEFNLAAGQVAQMIAIVSVSNYRIALSRQFTQSSSLLKLASVTAILFTLLSGQVLSAAHEVNNCTITPQLKSTTTQEKNIRRILADKALVSVQEIVKRLEQQGELGCLIATYDNYLAKLGKGGLKLSADHEEILLNVPNYLLLKLVSMKPEFWGTKSYRKLVAKLNKANDKHHFFQENNMLLNVVQYRSNVDASKDIYADALLTKNLRYVAPLLESYKKIYIKRLAKAKAFTFKTELKYWQGFYNEEICSPKLYQEKCSAKIGNRIVDDKLLYAKALSDATCNFIVIKNGKLLRFRLCD